MPLKIRAMRNNLGTSSSPFYALAVWDKVVEVNQFIDRLAEARTTLSKPDILGVFQLAREELDRCLAEGNYVKTPFGSALPVATGRFESERDPFLPARKSSGHSLRFEFRLDPEIESKALASLKIIRDRRPAEPAARVCYVISQVSGKRNVGEPDELLRVVGSRLKFDPANPALGLFFRAQDKSEVRARKYANVFPSNFIAFVPADLAEGEYELLVRTAGSNGTVLVGAMRERLRVASGA
ncbi:MAG: DUF4469 domain-containing protein [Treponema sp.]|nr:DUF4469 domain-containing protein [Treponema sp.]